MVRRNVLIGVVAALAVAVLVLVVTLSTHKKASSSRQPSGSPHDQPNATFMARLCENATQDAGYVALPNNPRNQYFYWYFEARSSPSTAPLVLWLSGGPGCSSMYALLTENGPCVVNATATDNSTRVNAFSWTEAANVVWLDQPTNTGYSHDADVRDNDASEATVAENLLGFVRGFLDQHPELHGRPLYLTGESYAGHYIPPAAVHLWEASQKNTSNSSGINLQGIAIGNGWVNPAVQYAHVLDMANNTYNASIVTPAIATNVGDALPTCLKLIHLCENGAGSCADAMSFCENRVSAFISMAELNPYDMRKPCAAGTIECEDMTALTNYMNAPHVREFLHVNASVAGSWEACDTNVYTGFQDDFVRSFDKDVAKLLNDTDIRVLLYVGDADMVCAWPGVHAWVTAMNWTHRDDFNNAAVRDFVAPNEAGDHVVAGTVQTYENQLSLVRVFNAGHMVPADQPAAALHMLKQFLASASL